MENLDFLKSALTSEKLKALFEFLDNKKAVVLKFISEKDTIIIKSFKEEFIIKQEEVKVNVKLYETEYHDILGVLYSLSEYLQSQGFKILDISNPLNDCKYWVEYTALVSKFPFKNTL